MANDVARDARTRAPRKHQQTSGASAAPRVALREKRSSFSATLATLRERRYNARRFDNENALTSRASCVAPPPLRDNASRVAARAGNTAAYLR